MSEPLDKPHPEHTLQGGASLFTALIHVLLCVFQRSYMRALLRQLQHGTAVSEKPVTEKTSCSNATEETSMIPMTPYQSWTTLLVLVLLAAAVLWLAHELSGARAERQSDRSAAAPLARVTILSTNGELSLVQDLPATPSPALYDWQIQGL